MRCMGHSPVHPLCVHTGQAFRIMLSGEHLRLEPAHRVGACCLSLKASPSNDDPHSWVLGQPFSVVGVLIASKMAVYRLPDQSHQLVLDVATTPALLQTGGRCLRQSQGIIQLAAGQESSVRGYSGAVEFQAYAAVKTERGAAVGAFTHWVPPERLRYPELTFAISARLAHLPAMMLTYAAQMRGLLADHDTPTGLIWEMWA